MHYLNVDTNHWRLLIESKSFGKNPEGIGKREKEIRDSREKIGSGDQEIS